MAVVGYVRVSTDKQDTDNQKGEIDRWCRNNGLKWDTIVSETISSRKTDRKIFDTIQGMNGGDVLIVTELSRIGRSLLEISSIIDHIVKHKIRIVVIKENIDLRDDDPMSMFGIHIMGAFAQLERSMISKRTKEAIASKREAGVKIGRPEGAKGKKRKLDGKESKIKEYLDKGMKKTEIARMLDVDRTVLYDKLAEMGVKSDV